MFIFLIRSETAGTSRGDFSAAAVQQELWGNVRADRSWGHFRLPTLYGKDALRNQRAHRHPIPNRSMRERRWPSADLNVVEARGLVDRHKPVWLLYSMWRSDSTRQLGRGETLKSLGADGLLPTWTRSGAWITCRFVRSSLVRFGDVGSGNQHEWAGWKSEPSRFVCRDGFAGMASRSMV